MITSDREAITRKTELRHFFRRLLAGMQVLKDNPKYLWIFPIYIILAFLLWIFRWNIFNIGSVGVFAPMIDSFVKLMLIVIYLICLFVIPLIAGTPRGSMAVRQCFQKAGLINHAGEPPVLISRQHSKETPELEIWIFDSCGIPMEDWENKKGDIEAALNLTVAEFAWENGYKKFLMYTVPAATALPDMLPWRDEYLSDKNFVLMLGRSYTRAVSVNLSHTPHVLLGGSTGSGKSVLLKLMLMQALKKGASVYIADFKGGVDFPSAWHYKCRMCFEEQDALTLLTELVTELESRKALLCDADCRNIDDYNLSSSSRLDRKIFACDEVAEMLDKTGRDKDDKELLKQIEGKLSTIARQGRAFGIHLILATQRPDANILAGQIKNNLDFRICGKADNVLSQIILDNTNAADQIPKDARGRFILSDGTVFQAYWLDESQL